MKYFVLILTILTTAFIFSNSIRPAEKSVDQSDNVTDVVVDVVEGATNQKQDHLKWSFIVRKAAHFSEFFTLGFLLVFTLYLFNIKLFGVFAFIGGFLTASIDETIQVFVDGRTGNFVDVLIDSSGVLTGILIFSLVLFILKKRNTKKTEVIE